MNFYNKTIISAVLGFLLAVTITSCQSSNDRVDIKGCWEIKMKTGMGDESYVFEFTGDGNKLTGRSHSYLVGSKTTPMELEQISYSAPDIEFVTNPDAGIKYRGTISDNGETLEGVIISPGGRETEFNLNRLSEAELKERYPGLAADNSSEYSYRTPKENGAGIDVSSAEGTGLETATLTELVNKFRAGEYGKMHSLLIYKDGALVLEEYFLGFSRDDLQAVRSVTKSIGSLLIGLAIDNGYMSYDDLDKPVFDFFPEYADLRTEKWDEIKLKHILSMSAGLDLNAQEDKKLQDESENVIKSTLELTPLIEPGRKWEYINVQTNLIAGVIKLTTGMHADEFARKYLFEPLNIEKTFWDYNKQNGYPMIEGSLTMRPIDMVKIGLLVLNNGTYKEKRIVSEKWMKLSTSPLMEIDAMMDYGYLWWLSKTKSAPDYRAVFANGWGSQFIVAFRGLNLVVVTNGANFNLAAHLKPLKMIDNVILKDIMD